MYPQEKIMSVIRRMDQIRVCPRITAGISLHDRKNGNFTDPGSVTLSFGASLLKWVLIAGGIAFSLYTWMWLCRRKRDRKIKEKYGKKLRRLKQKMSKS